MFFDSQLRNLGRSEKNPFFQKKKIEIEFLDLHRNLGKALNHSNLINEMKIMRNFSLQVIMESLLLNTFEALYLTQF